MDCPQKVFIDKIMFARRECRRVDIRSTHFDLYFCILRKRAQTACKTAGLKRLMTTMKSKEKILLDAHANEAKATEKKTKVHKEGEGN